jgi:subtilisin family serine protease
MEYPYMLFLQKNNLLVAVLYSAILFASPIYSNNVIAKEADVKTLNMQEVNKISFVSKADFLKTLRKTLKGSLVAEDVTKAIKPFTAPETRKRKYKSVGKLVKSLPLSADTIVRSVTELNLISDKVAIENLQLNVVESAIDLAGYETAFVKNKNSSSTALLALLPLAAVGGGGGGGGGGGVADGTYRDTISNSYGTEYRGNDALASQNILSLNDYGYTGAGVKVAVVDSGIDFSHQEFSGRTSYGRDFASSASGSGEDENGHGTHVASIIAGRRDGNGMRGMAYDATLYSYKVDNDGDPAFEGLSSDGAIGNIFDKHVTDNIKVSNNSWGSNTAITATNEGTIRAGNPLTIAAMRAAQNNGTVIVFASGNNSGSEVDVYGGSPHYITELVNEWLVVTAVDSNGNEPAYTNRCGVSSAFCVTAVGGDLTSAAGGVYAAKTGTNDSSTNNYIRYQGTSMAAPHVSGLVAALMEKFPSLSAAQIVTRVKDGASYNGLTGRGGETSANRTTAQLEAIFGHGLINGTASAARFGSYTYANGGSISGGVDLSKTKISLPAGLPLATQNQIIGSKFVVFDSFDGARFSVGGSEVFKTSNPTTARTYGSSKTIDTHADPSFAYFSGGEKVDPAKFSLRFIKTGNSKDMTSADGFWGSTASMFSSMPIIQGQHSTSFVWQQSLDRLIIQPFVQIYGEETSSKSFGGFGASFQMKLSEGLTAMTGYKFTNQNFDNGIMPDSSSAGSLKDFEVGFIQNISDSSNVFARFTNTQLQDLAATEKTFGFKNAEAEGWTVGYETQNSLGNFAFGISKPNQLSSGSVSLITPTGRTRSGDVLYKQTQFAVSNDDKLERFIAYSYDKDDTTLSLGMVEDRYNYGKLGAVKFNISMRF